MAKVYGNYRPSNQYSAPQKPHYGRSHGKVEAKALARRASYEQKQAEQIEAEVKALAQTWKDSPEVVLVATAFYLRILRPEALS